MGLVQRIKQDLRTGWASVRYGAEQAANRAWVETELLQMSRDLRKVDGRLGELSRDLGERAVELHERGVSTEQVLSDFEIVRSAEQAQELKLHRAKLLAEMDEAKTTA
ncbi:MAG: hypothetical protein ACKOCD_00660 [Nitrospiraceae bacterium]